MKKLWLILPAGLVLSMLSASAAIIPCGSTPLSFATWSTFNSTSNGCSIGDKIFSNFSVGSTPTDTSISFGQSGNNFTINFINTSGNGFNGNFGVGFDVRIDTTVAPANSGNWQIVKVTGGLTDSNADGNAVYSKTISSNNANLAAGNVTVTDTNGTVSSTILSGLHGTDIHVQESFTLGNGNITNLGNTFFQADTSIPEPLTLSLMGAGLLGLGLMRRRVSR